MLNADVLTFREFVMHETLPLSKIHQAVLEFLQGREDAVLFGAQAVNAYVELIASKIISYHSRKGKPKAGTDYRDLGMLLILFPETKNQVSEILKSKNVSRELLDTWQEIQNQDFQTDEDDDLVF